MKQYWVYLLIFPLFFVGCIANEDAKPSINKLITNRSSKTWISYSRLENGAETFIDCKKDDEWVFSSSGDIAANTGAVRCFINEKNQTDVYSFFLAGKDNNQFYFRFRDRDREFTVKTTIVKLTEDEFWFRYSFTDVRGSILNTVEYFFRKSDI